MVTTQTISGLTATTLAKTAPGQVKRGGMELCFRVSGAQSMMHGLCVKLRRGGCNLRSYQSPPGGDQSHATEVSTVGTLNILL